MADDDLLLEEEEQDDDQDEDQDEEQDDEEEIIEDDDDAEPESDIQSMDFGFDPENLTETMLTKTYAMDHLHHRIKGFIDGKEAVMQAIWKILSTTRYANMIYSDNYGCDIKNRIYNSSLSDQYLNTDVPAMVEEALMQDDRIKGVSDFEWERSESDGVHMSFVANTIYGDIQIEGEVS
jgi:phage baseplate assembly protein W